MPNMSKGKRRRSRVLAILYALLAFLAIWAVYALYASPPAGPMGEVIGPDEDVHTSQIVNSGISILRNGRVKNKDGIYRRDAHAKTHGCALADFSVAPNLEPPFRQGIFAGEKYKAWVRFSSGNEVTQSDWKPDARGMAIKVLAVPGKKLLEGEDSAQTQDFLMINNPVFFIRDVEEYARLTQFQGEGAQFGYFFEGANPFKWHLREFRLGIGLLRLPRALLATEFHSMTAYKLGPRNNVKFMAKPVACKAGGDTPSNWVSWNRNGLGNDLREHLKTDVACFDLTMQMQVPGKNMPVEDTTVRWSRSDSPFVTVARLELKKQDIQPQTDSKFCENLSFTPWHALPEHRPVGGLNRVRKAVYQNISRFRRCMNGVFFGEPLNDGTPKFDSKPCTATEPVPEVEGAKSAQ